MDNTQAIEQRAEKIAQHSEIEYKKADLREKNGGKPNKNKQVSAVQVYNELSHELRIVQKAERELAGVTGLEETIQSFETQATSRRFAQAKGASFELEIAMKVSQEEPILGLGVKAGGREIDIVTPTRYIECKNLDWELPNMISKTQNQLGRLDQLANANNKIITLHSKNQIPASLKSWCNSRGVQYCEGLI